MSENVVCSKDSILAFQAEQAQKWTRVSRALTNLKKELIDIRDSEDVITKERIAELLRVYFK